MNKQYSGFTLIELLIAVAIVGILSAIVYPAYLKQVQESNRSDAKIMMSEAAQRLQRCFTAQSTYNPDEGVCTVVDELKSDDGIASTEGFYVVKIANDDDLTASTYLLTGTAVSDERQASDEECATFTQAQTGVKAALNKDGDDTTDECW